MNPKTHRRRKAIFAFALFAITAALFFMFWKAAKDLLKTHNELATAFSAFDKEHKRILSGRDRRLWRTPTRDFFSSQELNDLCKAISEADDRKIQELLDADVDLNAVGEDGMTVLFFAYMEGEYPGFIRLLAKGAKPDVPLAEKQEVLPMNMPVNEGETVMFAACRNPWERRRYIQPALTNADNTSLQDSRGHTVLLHQMLGLSPPIIKSVLLEVKDCGIDPTIRDKAGKTARDYAVEIAPDLLPIFDAMMEKAKAKE